MKKSLLYLFCISINSVFLMQAIQKAIIIVPVADLIGAPVSNIKTYKRLPLCGGKINPFEACIRMNQLLFNVIVEVLEQKNNQVKITIPHLFFTTKTNTQPYTTYWTHADNIILLDTLHEKGLNIDKIPQPFDFKKNNIEYAMRNTIVLLRPHYDKKIEYHFSAGTRFVQVNTKKNKTNYHHVYAFDKKTMAFKTLLLPKKVCLVQSKLTTHKQRTQLFVKLLRSWTHLNNGVIPYVWGGCSFIGTSNDRGFSETIHIQNDKPAYSFFTKTDCTESPKTGLDCTGLIALAAQIAGIPYFLKNSTTITQHLQQIKKDQPFEEGDIIWIDRHAMVISNIKKNLLVEARHYSHGYGIVHEIPLHKQFKQITTYKKLADAVFNKKRFQE